MTSSTSSFRGVMASVADRVREHHNSVNAAYMTFYGIPADTSRSNSTSTTSSKQSTSTTASQKVSSAWGKVKQHAREHHASVNAAYQQLYYPGARA